MEEKGYNIFFREKAIQLELTSPDLLAPIRLPKKHYLYLSDCDISQLYNIIQVPSPHIRSFLPSVLCKDSDTKVGVNM